MLVNHIYKWWLTIRKSIKYYLGYKILKVGKNIYIITPEGKRVRVYVSNNPEMRAKQEARLQAKYGASYDLKKGARREREYDELKAKARAADPTPEYAKNVKNYQDLSLIARKKLYKSSPQYAQYKKDLALYEAQKAIYERGTKQADAIYNRQMQEFKAGENKTFTPVSPAPVSPAKRVKYGFKSGDISTEQTLTELRSLKQSDTDMMLRQQKTGFEKRVDKINIAEEKAAKRWEDTSDWFQFGPLKGKGYFKEVGRAALAAPIRWTSGAAESSYIAGMKYSAALEAKFKGQGDKVQLESKRAAKETAPTVLKSMNPTTPEGLVNLVGVAIGVKTGGRPVSLTKPKPKVSPKIIDMKVKGGKATPKYEGIGTKIKNWWSTRKDGPKEYTEAKFKPMKEGEQVQTKWTKGKIKEKIKEAEVWKQKEKVGKEPFRRSTELQRSRKTALERTKPKPLSRPIIPRTPIRPKTGGVIKGSKPPAPIKSNSLTIPKDTPTKPPNIYRPKPPKIIDRPKPPKIIDKPKSPTRPKDPYKSSFGNRIKGGLPPLFGKLDLPDIGGGGGGPLWGRKTKGRSGKKTYLPSISAITFNIKGTRPKGKLTGLEMRPIVGGK